MDEKTIVSIPKDLRKFELKDGETVIFDPLGVNWITINEIGLRIIDLCDGRKTIEQVASQLISLYQNVQLEETLSDTLEFVKELSECKLAFAEDDEMATRGMIEEQSRIELEKFRFVLLHAVLNVTNACNLNCVHCFVDAKKPLGNELSLQEWQDIACQMKGLTDKAIGLAITITGGEPLMREDLRQLRA